jgi:deazaflavin-dependent oxidoreductase (nitroreductase family)
VAAHYQPAGWFTHNVLNRLVATLTRAGVSVAGSRVLEVKGRSSGTWRRTPVNLLPFEGADYLISPRGQTQWVRNIRVSGGGRLRLGRRVDVFSAEEVTGELRIALLRAYLKRWAWEVSQFFDGVNAESSDDELRRIAADHPVFRVMRS